MVNASVPRRTGGLALRARSTSGWNSGSAAIVSKSR